MGWVTTGVTPLTLRGIFCNTPVHPVTHHGLVSGLELWKHINTHSFEPSVQFIDPNYLVYSVNQTAQNQ